MKSRRRDIARVQSDRSRPKRVGHTMGSGLGAAGLLLCYLAPSPAYAQSAEQLADLRQELAELKAAQTKTAERIAAVEKAMETLAASRTTPLSATRSADEAGASAAHGLQAGSQDETPRLSLSGDLRLRYEANTGDSDSRDRHRGVLRARLRGSYAVTSSLSVGAQLSTGDPDDPNTADVTLSNFADDLAVSLDQAFARYSAGPLTMTGGKIPLPFIRTDLVWDGDVNPQGLSAIYRLDTTGGSVLKAAGLYFMVDEASGGADSRMIGGQVSVATPPGRVQIDGAVAYYDYRLAALAGADVGDFRSNLRTISGSYLSDFNLLDVIGSVSYSGLGERWPVRLAGDYVRNLGTRASADTGFAIDALVGRSAVPGDWRFSYGYSQAEVDAVFAAFSNDNLTIGTNYRLHALSIDYVPQSHTALNLTWYHYRPLDPAYAGGDLPADWLERVRLNFLFDF